MEILGSLGIDIKLLIAQIINFGILLLLLTKFVYKPIIKKIEKDEELLKKAQTLQNNIEHEMSTNSEEQKKEIVKAKQRAREIIDEAENIAKDIKNNSRDEVEKEKKEVIQQIQSRLSEMNNGKRKK
ncbi:MAG: hypothetical protein Q8P90_00180 [bacterium]|nr:hypothetical protein [bacterium]